MVLKFEDFVNTDMAPGNHWLCFSRNDCFEKVFNLSWFLKMLSMKIAFNNCESKVCE